MPTLSFTILNTQDDQSFTVNDLKDTTHNPMWTGAINHNDPSPSISCWQGSDGTGQIQIIGTVSVGQQADVTQDGQQIPF